MTAPRARLNWWLVGTPLAMVAVLFLCNPVEHSFFPPCVFHKLTGWHCPGCGATRAVHALLHARLGEAWRDNALLVLAVPAGVVLAARYFARGRRAEFLSRREGWLLAAVVVAFGVVRNLPLGAALAP